MAAIYVLPSHLKNVKLIYQIYAWYENTINSYSTKIAKKRKLYDNLTFYFKCLEQQNRIAN